MGGVCLPALACLFFSVSATVSLAPTTILPFSPPLLVAGAMRAIEVIVRNLLVLDKGWIRGVSDHRMMPFGSPQTDWPLPWHKREPPGPDSLFFVCDHICHELEWQMHKLSLGSEAKDITSLSLTFLCWEEHRALWKWIC